MARRYFETRDIPYCFLEQMFYYLALEIHPEGPNRLEQ